MRDIWMPPNLLSLARIALLAPVVYFLSRSGDESRLMCILLIIVAGITDGLDGWLARRMGCVSRLGIALDPIADKIFAGGLVISLVVYRDMPIWLAGVILGRDLLIMILGLILMRGRQLSLPSNLTGKYAFTAVVVLLGSYVLDFRFGIALFLPLTLVLLVASLIAYGRVFLRIRAGLQPPQFKDLPAFRNARIALTAAISIVFLIELYIAFFN